MHNARAEHMFNFGYRKTSAEINEKLTTKVLQLKKKVEERRGRIARLKAEHKITDAVYIDLLEQARADQSRNNLQKMSYSVSSSAQGGGGGGGVKEEDIVVGAGVVMNLLTETDTARNEETQATRFELIVRNLKDLPNDEGKVMGHKLSEEELTYLGF